MTPHKITPQTAEGEVAKRLAVLIDADNTQASVNEAVAIQSFIVARN